MIIYCIGSCSPHDDIPRIFSLAIATSGADGLPTLCQLVPWNN
jgi:hypothetical protein